MHALALDALARRVTEVLGRGGLRTLVLKGPVTAERLYGSAQGRRYADVDLLINPSDLCEAMELLAPLGLADALAGATSQEVAAHSRLLTCQWGQWHLELDLHVSLPSLKPSAALFDRFWCDREFLTIAGAPLACIPAYGTALVVCLHALVNGASGAQAREDLDRAVARLEPGTWRRAVAALPDEVSRESMAAGLSLAAEGAALASSLDLPRAWSPRLSLLVTDAGGVAVRLAEVAELEGRRAQARWWVREVFPSRGAMRSTYGGASPAHYVRRLGRHARRLPSALRAVRAARH